MRIRFFFSWYFFIICPSYSSEKILTDLNYSNPTSRAILYSQYDVNASFNYYAKQTAKSIEKHQHFLRTIASSWKTQFFFQTIIYVELTQLQYQKTGAAANDDWMS